MDSRSPRSPGSPSSVDFARPRLNFTGNCPNWNRRLVVCSVSTPSFFQIHSSAQCLHWLDLDRATSHATPTRLFSRPSLPPSDNDSAIRPSNPPPSQLRPSPIKPPPRPPPRSPSSTRFDSDRRRHNPPRGMERNLQTSRRGSPPARSLVMLYLSGSGVEGNIWELGRSVVETVGRSDSD